MRSIRRLPADEKGTFIVFFAIALAALLGMVALSFDLGRVASTQSELQSFADSMALAAAAELDGTSDSIDRARAAAALITDTQTFSPDGEALSYVANDPTSDVTLTFLSSLPADDRDAATAVTTVQTAAVYVRVDVTPHEVPMAFASALSVLINQTPSTPEVGATATAGFTQVACAVTPLMFCLPPSHTPTTPYTADANIGDMIIFRSSRQNAAWEPGNFGFLDPTLTAIPDPNGPCAGLPANGQQLWTCLVGAAGNLVQCYSMRGVATEPGQRVGIAAAFNARFDVYEATMGGERNDPAYAPAPNTIKGFANVRTGGGNGQCNMEIGTGTAASVPLPRDTCLGSTCGDRFGDGIWDRPTYIAANHGTNPPPRATGADPALASTRYQLYLDEIAAATAGRILPADKTESGIAQCHANPSSDPSRRVLIAAGVDCNTNTFSGRALNVPVEEFFRIFLTEPSQQHGTDTPPNIDIAGEIIGSAGGAGSTPEGIFRDVVQLYR